MESPDKRHPSEPFKPEDTPAPPQAQHPGRSGEETPAKPDTSKEQKKKSVDSGKRLGEAPIESDDETTI